MRWLWHLYLCWVPERELLRETQRRETDDLMKLFRWLEEPLDGERSVETPGPWWTKS